MEDFKVRRLILGEVATNCYLMKNLNTGDILVVDPADEAGWIEAEAKKLDGRITDILLTHGHYDHIGAVGELRKNTGATVWAHREEEKVLSDPYMNLSDDMGGMDICVKADRLVSDKDEITAAGFNCRVLHTPGHTPGGCCFYFPDECLVYAGDTLFDHSVGRTDFPGGSMSALIRSIREKLFTLPEETVVLPGHGYSTQIGIEKEENPFAAC